MDGYGAGDAPTMNDASSAVLLKVMLRTAFIVQSDASSHVLYFGGRPLRLRLACSSGASLFAAAGIALTTLPSYGVMSVGWFVRGRMVYGEKQLLRISTLHPHAIFFRKFTMYLLFP